MKILNDKPQLGMPIDRDLAETMDMLEDRAKDKLCKTCKWWGVDGMLLNYGLGDLRHCCHDKMEDYVDVDYIDEGYAEKLYLRENFGCVLWEEKEKP